MNAAFLLDLAWRSWAVCLAAWLMLALLRRASASARHFVCAAAFGGLLLLPLGFWLPRWQVQIKIAPLTWSQSEPPAAALSGGGTLAWAVVIVWAVGAGLFLTQFAFAAAAVRRWKNSAIPVRSSRLLAAFQTAAASLGFERTPALLMGSAGIMPVALGWRRGAVLLPADAEDWDDERLRLVLLHELGHLRRHDPWHQAAAALGCAVHWFNPLAWLLERKLRQEREAACDALVVECGVPALGYARHLLEWVTSAGTAATLAPALGGSNLKQRITRLLKPTSRRVPAWLAALLIVSGFGALTSAAFVQPSAPREHPQPSWTPQEVQRRLDANPFPAEPEFSVGH